MGLLQECQLVQNARHIAVQRGLDPSKVSCCGCVEGADCKYSTEGLLGELSSMDAIQDARLGTLEGEQSLKRFDRKLLGHVQAQAIIENQHRS